MKPVVKIEGISCKKEMLVAVDLVERLGGIPYTKAVAVIVDV